MGKAVLFHDGCGICLGIAETFSGLFDPASVLFETVDLGRERARLSEAQEAGVTMLPSLVIAGRVLPVDPHFDINHLLPGRKTA